MADTDPTDKRPPPKDISHHLSRNAKSRQPSSIKAFYKYFQIPGIGQLAGGLPNQDYFPFDTLEAKTAYPNRWKPTPNKPVDPHDEKAGPTKDTSKPLPQSRLVVPHASKEQNPLKKIDLDTALQYGTAQGYPPLYYFLREMTKNHLQPNIPYRGGGEIILTCGNTDGFNKVLLALTNEWFEDRDWIRDKEGILVEEFCFMSPVQGAKPRGLNIVSVKMDRQGMLADGPGGLKEVLENWDHNRGKRPHLLYTVTMGQNPTSGVLSLQRRRDLYAIACKYDVIIVEDDPYWYLQFPSAISKSAQQTTDSLSEHNPAEWKSSGYEFLDSLVPSSLNIDTEGRVIRLDTFSKTVAPGCRLGWITAQPALIERLLRITETSTQQPSGFVQSIIAELLLGPPKDGAGKGPADGAGWSGDGWIRWVEGLRGNYERRMNAMCKILDGGKEIVKSGRRNSLSEEMATCSVDGGEDVDEWSVVEKTQMYSFDWPEGGMFVWIKMHAHNHPLASKIDGAQLIHALWLFLTTKPFLVLASPGAIFSPTPEIAKQEGWKYFRICFAACNLDELEPITHRMVEGINAFWRIKNVKKIQELLDDEEAALEKTVGEQDLSRMQQLMGPC